MRNFQKGEKRVVQEGQKGRKIALGGSFSRKWCGKPEGTGCLCRARSSEITEVGTKKCWSTPQQENHNRRAETSHVSEGLVATATPQASLEVEGGA